VAAAFQPVLPVIFARVTQRFGARPEYYKQFGLVGHEGVDFGGATGDVVLSIASGVVKLAVHGDGKHPYGTHVRIVHQTREGEFESIYAHLSELDVQTGDVVDRGQVIGALGSSGNSTGPHLHLTLKKRGATARGETRYPSDIIDPTPFFDLG
jgi:murein DD-endopeptidase MepM/ murein hydrolase activator NlpD